MRRILFITNGHGEDLVAAEIIKKFGREAAPTVFPVVGEGKIFESLNIQVLGPKRKLPSGGFSLRNLFYLAQDIYAGLTKDTLEKIRILRGLRGNFDLVVAIGDIVPIIGALMVKAPFIFVGVNKSSYYKWFGFNYTPWEKLLLQKHALKVFVRDKATERSLKSYGVKIPSAEYAGNPLMDCIGKIPTKVGEGVRIGFLPGTRADAYLNLQDFRKVAKEIMLLKTQI